MKLNQITASLLFTACSQLFALPASADRIIQKVSGDFYIVSDRDAYRVYDQNGMGLFRLAPSINLPYEQHEGVQRQKHRISKTTVSNPVVGNIYDTGVNKKSKPTPKANPVTTVESAESIFLRLEKKSHEH